MKIKTQLILLLSFISIAFIIVGAFGFQAIKVSQQGIHEVYKGGIDSIEELDNITNYFDHTVPSTIHQILSGKMTWENGITQITEIKETIPKIWSRYLKTELTAEQQELATRLQPLIEKGLASLNKLVEIVKRQHKEELTTYLFDELYSVIDPIEQLQNELIKQHITQTKIDYETALTKSKFMTDISIFSIIFAIIVSVIFAIFIIRSITIPLDETISVINRVALGDISPQFKISSENEFGQLMKAFQSMLDSTKKMIVVLAKVSNGDLTGSVQIRSEDDLLGKAINDMVIRLKQMISETQEEVTVLTSSTQEIMASISQVSTGTAETAAAVTETTTTMEELKQTAQVSAEKAQDVLSGAETTLQIVKTSEQSVSTTIGDMNQIQEKMRIISDSIIKLSEHSLTIGEIIGTVNDLAEQSNLLAVNAAIEAAKAGDQGKSFGVVAQEIRTLAEQSKAATVQVKGILNDIQSATSAAVMATEQGSKVVMKGVDQSSQTTIAMQSLSASISKGAQAAKQIALSSQQQLIGVEQVTTAMANINQASNQHVEHMRQIEQAITSLNEVGGILKVLISQYVLNTDDLPMKSKKNLNSKWKNKE